ncbi:MAG: GTP cyclohydrolase I FolE [Planctomycetes bacterium]|nr:GTP cyclohydrolase I FolE [Planctomycetota bacterium]
MEGKETDVEDLIRKLLIAVGEDPEREGLRETPRRVARSLEFLTSGYTEDLDAIIKNAIFTEECNHMVIVRDVEVYSLCEHHMLPFFGRCHIGYIPKGKVFGVSKLARIADFYARRLQLQERLTSQIAHTIMERIEPEGVGVVMQCKHLCMMMRGVEKQNSIMVTSAVLGSFHNSSATRNEFLRLVAGDDPTRSG